jgi:hypothetical protein
MGAESRPEGSAMNYEQMIVAMDAADKTMQFSIHMLYAVIVGYCFLVPYQLWTIYRYYHPSVGQKP